VGKRRQKVLDDLRRAQDERALVRLDRGKDVDRVDGYVVSVGAEWVLLAYLDGAIVFDGHTALRVEDVRHVRHLPNADMVRQALTLRGQWPPAPPPEALDLDDVRGLLTSLAAQPLVAVHLEHDDPDSCWIGAPAGLGDRSLRLLEIMPSAVWNTRPTKHRVERITRVGIGGRYEDALLSVAGPPPALD